MSIVVLIQRVMDKIAMEWRNRVFSRSVLSAGSTSIYGRIYLVNKNIKSGNNVKIYPGVQFFGDGPIEIGDNVSIGNNTMIYATKGEGVMIGDNTIIAAQSYLVDMNHGMDANKLIREQKALASRIVIENDVWIGANVTVLKGVHIAHGAVIGAKALVNKNVDMNTVVAGVPARLIAHRRSET